MTNFSSILSTADTLTMLLPRAAALSEAPISSFPVGAVALGASGCAWLGANMEFSDCSITTSIHAEQAAVYNAWSHGEENITHLATTANPCGFCRQFLWELSCRHQLTVLLPGQQPLNLTDLLPHGFALEHAPGFGSHHLMELPPCTDDSELALAAWHAAAKSYVPCTQQAVGVALLGAQGTIWSGATVENSAYNPTLTAPQTALLTRHLEGGDSESVIRAFLWHLEGPASQEHLFEELISSQFPGASLFCLKAYTDSGTHSS